MDPSITIDINLPAHTPHQLSLKVARHSTVQDVKEQIRQHLREPTLAADFALLYGQSALDETDTLDEVLKMADAPSATAMQLIVCPVYRIDNGVAHVGKLAYPASIQFRVSPSSPTAHTTGYGSETHTHAASKGNHAYHPCAKTFTSSINTGVAHAHVSALSSQYTLTPPIHWGHFQYAIINGMPYLIPSIFGQHLLYQQQEFITNYQPRHYPLSVVNNFHYNGAHQSSTNTQTQQQQPLPAQDGAGANPVIQRNVARDQRRAAVIWLSMKLAFGVYVFGQNGSVERIVLLNIIALVIFLHQTGRLRIVRRIVRTPQEAPQVPADIAATEPQIVTSAETSTPARSLLSSSTEGESSRINEKDARNTDKLIGSEEAAAESKRELSSGSAQQQRAMAVDSDAQDTCIKTEGTKEQAHDNIAATSGDISSLPLSAQQQHQQNQQEQGREMAQGSAWRNVKHAMITFITSLIPAPPPEIDQAEVDAIEGERVL